MRAQLAMFLAIGVAPGVTVLAGCSAGSAQPAASSSAQSSAGSAPQMEQLTLVISGSGTVASAPLDIDCSSGCTLTLASGTTLNLTASAASGWSFGGFSGACT